MDLSFLFAGVAQLAVRVICNLEVGGSSPFASSIRTWLKLWVANEIFSHFSIFLKHEGA